VEGKVVHRMTSSYTAAQNPPILAPGYNQPKQEEA